MIDRFATVLSARDFEPTELEEFRYSAGLQPNDGWRCPWRTSKTERCGALLVGDDVVCCALHEPKRHENHLRRVDAKRREAIDDVCKRMRDAPVLQEMPRLDHARVGGALFESKAAPNFRALAARWQPQHGSVLLSGAPGTWKTSACVALIHRMLDAAPEELAKLDLDALRRVSLNREMQYYGDEYRILTGTVSPEEPSCTFAARAVWTTGLELIHAVRRHPLGQGEPPLMRVAKVAPLLVLDELGPQAGVDRDGVVVEVVWARSSRQLPTIATTGMSDSEFQEAHGGGLWRRLTEAGTGRFLRAKGLT